MIPAANLRFMWDVVINPRIGSAYSWGGSFNPNDVHVGTDCSGAVSAVIEALVNGPNMDWNRQFWTGTFAGLNPGDVGPFGLVCIPNPGAAPQDAAAIVAINQGPSADTSHMIVRVMDRTIDPEGVDIEDDGDGLQKYDRAANITDPQFNQWFFLPGPIEGATTAPLSRSDRYAIAIIREGQRRGITPRGIQIALATALVESNLTNYANSRDSASMALPHDAVGNDGMSVGVFQQQNFPEWGPLECRMDPACSAGVFYDHLARLDYNGPNSPGSYAQAVQRSAFPDRYDERFDEAVAIYTRLAGAAPSPWPPPAPPQPPISEGDDMAQVPQAQWDQLFHALMDPVPSQSPLRELGEGTIGSIAKLIRNIDGSVHVAIVEALAKLGDPEELARLHRIATADPVRYPDRQKDAVLAATILARIAAHPDTTTAPAQPPVPVVPIPPWPTTPPPGSSTTGQHVGQLYDALEQLHLAGTLPPEVQAPLAALINVLQSYPHEGT